jgi:hypothetical protein
MSFLPTCLEAFEVAGWLPSFITWLGHRISSCGISGFQYDYTHHTVILMQ